MPIKKVFFPVFFLCLLVGCEDDETNGTLTLQQVFIGSTEISLTGTVSSDLPIDRAISLVFSLPVDQSTAVDAISLMNETDVIDIDISFLSDTKTAVIYPVGSLENNTTYTITISDQLKGSKGENFVPLNVSFKTILGDLSITSFTIGGVDVGTPNRITDVPLSLSIEINFSLSLDESIVQNAISLSGPDVPGLEFTLYNENKTINISSTSPLKYLTRYNFAISNSLKGAAGENFSGLSKTLYTVVDETPKFPLISDEELLTKVQQQTFNYFWEFAQPNSGMARERNTSGDLVTSGGSGFALMAIIVGIERNFITRQEGIERLDKILDFLETADRFHGVWSHWINGNTGDVIPFSSNDNGGDLVETSYLIQGLLTFRQYLNVSEPTEQALINRINALWESVEWDWYTRGGQEVLYWHWSPDKEWTMNHQIKGYNECLITYVLAASSTTHPIDKDVYTKGWASDGAIVNGDSFYDITLPLGYDFGGPLFFAHYSFLGLDPRNLSDTYGNYWTQNVNHTMINREHCIVNPQKFVGYSERNWGLTASDNHLGYSAHSPTNDLGVITPTAALSSFPYTPVESLEALKFFYYTLGDRIWGPYGFYDAFNVTENWYATSTLAIDQGPIIVMIENYRTGLLWDLFMSCPEVQDGLDKLGFNY